MYIESALLGSVVGTAGTVLGGIIAMLIGKRVKASRPYLAFAGGLMVAVVFFDMLIESAALGGIIVMGCGTAAGGVFFSLLAPFISHKHEPSLYATGLLVLTGIALHNLPEGLAIGSSLVESERLALSLSLLMLVHNIPEGLAVCLPFRLSGMPVFKMLFLAFLTGMPTAAGALIGTAVGSISRGMVSLCISFAGGAMLYISLKELIPAGGEKKRALFALFGLCSGFIMTRMI
ncbi:MAG: ZIP family metal transporter [Eubacteriales bacterium]|nr:ZIP family metal transporter [Eubacteriales bacterium]